MGTVLDLNPRLQAARQARASQRALMPNLADLAFVNMRLALLPLLMLNEALGALGTEDGPSAD